MHKSSGLAGSLSTEPLQIVLVQLSYLEDAGFLKRLAMSLLPALWRGLKVLVLASVRRAGKFTSKPIWA